MYMHLHVQGNQVEALTQRLSLGFSSVDGVFVKALDNAVRTFNEERQAYYGGTYHVHSSLEVNTLLCLSVCTFMHCTM